MANKYKSSSKTLSDGSTQTTYRRQKDGIMGGYENSHRVTSRPNGDVKVERKSKSLWRDWD